MKAAEWKRVARPLIPTGERWEFRGALCYRAPVGRLLFGALGEGSGFDSGVYIWRVSMPLFVPSDVVILSYSERVGGGSKKYDNADGDELSLAIATSMRDLPTERDELERLIKIAHASPNPNLRLLEAAASSQVLLSDQVGARETIKQATRLPTRYDWETEVVARLARLATALDEKGLEAASRDLDAETRRTATALGLIHG